MAQFPANIDLSSLDGSTGFKLSGTAAGDRSGWSVASAGDVNGDGFADVIVGAIFAAPNGSQSGAGYVVFGQASGFGANIALSSLDGSTGFKLSGAAAGNYSGWSVASAGDVNGDGFADVIVGAPNADPNGNNNAGASYVVFGQASGFAANIDLSSLDGSTGFRLSGASAADSSGRSVASAGDVNGDGFADLIVGAIGNDSPFTNAGASYVVFGKASGFAANINLASLDGSTGFKLSGAASDDRSGSAVASAGDINGDGFADVIVGAYYADPHGIASSGASYVVFGKDSGFAANIFLSSLDGTTGFKLSGEATSGRSGRTVASAGDVNGDGFDDLIVGALGSASCVVFGKASGFAANIDLSSLDGTTGFRLGGSTAAASAGDVNGDGFADLIVGSAYDSPHGASSGASYIVFGKASGFAANIDLSSVADGTTGFKLSGEAANDRAGSSAASAGDVNDDGFADLIVGARFASGASGASYVVFGKLPDTAVNRTGTDAAQTLAGGDFNDTLAGLGGDDTLYGNGGNDTLDGGTGNDTMLGGAGNDTYVVDSALDVVTEALNEGTDTVQASVTYTLSANVENLTLTGSGNINGTGNALDNVITSNTGVDLLAGGAGNDTYIVNNSADVVLENNGAGTDTVQASVTYTLSANVENLTLTGSGNINGTGNALDNVITGNGGINTLTGGAGNDTYVVNNINDVVIEAANAGTDEVRTELASYSLAAIANVENLTGAAATGQTLTGNSLANTITGGIGNDTLDGGTGNDTLVGGAGDDSYFVDSISDVVTEGANQGTDTVQSSVTYTLSANVENLTLAGSGNINGTGNGDANSITGNAGNNTLTGLAGADIIAGGAGNDTLDGGAGNDTMTGGLGDDIYFVDSLFDVVTEVANAGTDEVLTSLASYSLAAIANVENLTGIAATGQTLTGDSLANSITGGIGNDTLDGGAGGDTLTGGGGSDTASYASSGAGVTINLAAGTASGGDAQGDTLSGIQNIIGSAQADTLTGDGNANTFEGGAGGDTIDGGGGNDTASYAASAASVTINLAAGTAAGGDAQGDTLSGIESLIGGAQADMLTGDGNANTLDGGAGADVLTGGLGNDTYVVDSILDAVTENANEGTDTVDASIHYRLGANFENLMLLGSADLQGYGNELANTLTGNDGSNVLDGGAGADTMQGGLGDDAYFLDNGGDVVIENANEGNDTVYASFDYRLGANVEYLVLQGSAVGGYGNSLSNAIVGNGNDNLLDGGAGADAMYGGAGSDSYFLDNGGDVVIENANDGNDAVYASFDYRLGANVEYLVLQGSAVGGYGNSLSNAIVGTGNDNLLDGGTGADAMYGGAGSDSYFVDNSGDVVIENANDGNDAVYASIDYRLGANVEYLVLQGGAVQGYGNSSSNAIVGNTGNNLLNGEGGADAMYGGAGNDVYFVDDAGDVVIENANEGNDTVYASIDYGLTANVDNLILQGSANLQAYGNNGVNALFGNSGNNILNGEGGADHMFGGAGNDVYVVDNVGDLVVEAVGAGNDTVYASVNYALTANVDNLILQEGSAVQATGNSGVNAIFGNSGNNTLDGGGGADVLIGGAGNDTFVFNVGQANGDTIIDFAGNGAGAGDTLTFVGFGTAAQGATLTQIGASNQWLIHSGIGGADETITLLNGATVDASDVLFA